MFIIFGVKYFTIGSFSRRKLGMTEDTTYTGEMFEYRQAYFHLFFIPIIGLGKSWIMYSKARYYDLPDDVRRYINKSDKKFGSIWYRNLGIYLVIAIYFSYLGLSSYSQNRAIALQYENNLITIKNIKKYIQQPKIGDQYSFDFNSFIANQNKVFEVHAFSRDSIQLTVPLPRVTSVEQESEYENLTTDEIKEKLLVDMKEKQRLEDSIAIHFPIRQRILEGLIANKLMANDPESETYRFIWVSKANLLKSAPKTPEQVSTLKGIFLPELLTVLNFKLKLCKITRFE